MKAIDSLLMTPQEAVVEAAKTNQLKWLQDLLGQHAFKVLNVALVDAARDGSVEAVKVLTLKVIGDQTGTLQSTKFEVLKSAAIAAAGNGHLPVVELLFSELNAYERHDKSEDEEDSDYDDTAGEYSSSCHDGAQEIFDAAAANGHLRVAHFVANCAPVTFSHESHALHLAVVGGYVDIVRFLLETAKYTWAHTETLELAVDEGHHRIAELIYAGWPNNRGECLLSYLAQQGNTKLVAYLYKFARAEPEVIEDAFIKAARHGRTDVVAFMLDNGPISSEAFNLGFEDAAAAGSIIAAFRSAAESIGGNTDYHTQRKNIKILEILSKGQCIPREDINNVVARATRAYQPSILKSFGNDYRLSPETFAKAFSKSIEEGCVEVVEAFLQGKLMSVNLATCGLMKAAACGHAAIVFSLLKKPMIAATAKQESLVTAASHNRNCIVQDMCKQFEWPIKVLKGALRATHSRRLTKFLRTNFDLSEVENSFTT
ncbi:unnamed protein product [Phytophthora lilii]|uniref:Unnamed protein product n=1 Tax=Phytophthora lilii TaxID=2077276 RepID=A0A9W6UBQ6_9STRA|nr:unnamed protein product [Phytophthora lilii]